MTRLAKRRALVTFLVAAAVQALGLPLISKVFGLGDRLHAPSWVVIVLTSGLMAAIAASTARAERP